MGRTGKGLLKGYLPVRFFIVFYTYLCYAYTQRGVIMGLNNFTASDIARFKASGVDVEGLVAKAWEIGSITAAAAACKVSNLQLSSLLGNETIKEIVVELDRFNAQVLHDKVVDQATNGEVIETDTGSRRVFDVKKQNIVLKALRPDIYGDRLAVTTKETPTDKLTTDELEKEILAIVERQSTEVSREATES